VTCAKITEKQAININKSPIYRQTKIIIGQNLWPTKATETDL